MGWQGLLVSAIGAKTFKEQGAIGKYNQDVNERNALTLESQANQLEKKKEFDIARFDKNFRKLEGETTVALARSGVQLGSGTAANIELANAIEAEIQRNLIEYNSKVAIANKIEEANFARIKGVMARNEAKLAQLGTLANTSTSLLTMMKT